MIAPDKSVLTAVRAGVGSAFPGSHTAVAQDVPNAEGIFGLVAFNDTTRLAVRLWWNGKEVTSLSVSADPGRSVHAVRGEKKLATEVAAAIREAIA